MSIRESIKAIFPPTPPLSDNDGSDYCSISSDDDGGSIPLPPRSVAPKEILPVDLNSPDNHVARDPRLVRITGNHPFNSEAPLTALFEAGFPFLRNVALIFRIFNTIRTLLRSKSWRGTSSPGRTDPKLEGFNRRVSPLL